MTQNVNVLPAGIPQSALPPTGLPIGLSITPTTVKVGSTATSGIGGVKGQVPQAAHQRHVNSHKTGTVPAMLRGVRTDY